MHLRDNYNIQILIRPITTKMESNIQDSILCLNPFCEFKQTRVLTIETKQNHNQCSQWFLNRSDIQNSSKSVQYNLSQDQRQFIIKNFSTDFLSKPIMSSIKFFQMKQINMKQFIKNLFDNSLNNIIKIFKQKLLQLFGQTYEEICGLIDAGSQVWQEIQKIVQLTSPQQLSTQKALNSPAFNEKLKAIQNFGKINLMNQDIINEKIKRIVQELQIVPQGYLFRQRKEQLQQRKKEFYSYKQVTQFLNQQKLGVVNKLQKLASIFGAPQPQFQMQQKCRYPSDLSNCEQIIQKPDKQVRNRSSTLRQPKCWICQEIIQFNSDNLNTNAKNKRLAAQKLLQHLMQNHWKVIEYQILTKKMKLKTYKISFELFLFEINNLQYLYETKGERKFIIIDRENAGKFQLSPHQLNQFYVIEVMNQANENLARGKYMVAQSKGKDAADLLSVLLVYQISKVKHSTIYLITNDHYGITLKQILQPLGITIICHGSDFTDYRMPKKYGSSNRANVNKA